jgi:hypothetical protein
MSTPTISANPAESVKGWMAGLDLVDPPVPAAAPAEPKEPDDQTNDPKPSVDVPVGNSAATPTTKPAVDAVAKPIDAAKLSEGDEESKWPRTAQQWKEFKKARSEEVQKRDDEIKALKTERDDIKKKITDTPASPELDSLKKERDDLSERLRILDVERHPKFTAYFKNKIDTQVDLAKRIVGTEYAETAAKLLALPDGQYKDAQIEEMLINLSPLQQSRFGSVLNSMSEIEGERQSEITRSKENFDKLKSDQAAAREQQSKGIEKAFNEAAIKAQESNPVFKKREGDHAWNTEVEKRLETARNLFFGKGVKSEQVIQASLDAASLPAILTGYEAMYKENERLKSQISELSKASPSIQSRETSSDGSPKPVAIKVGMRPNEATNAWVRSVTAE